jgi:REP element-mobilizing transposase RayT
MARPLRIEFPGAIYHVTSRGNAKQFIFLDDRDRLSFLEIFTYVAERFQFICHAYCLMGNHYHLIIETPDANLSRGLRQLNGVYTQRFNRMHGSVGHIFQGRYKAILVERESYLLTLCRYVLNNPVHSGLVRRAEQWKWSSFKATAGEIEPPPFLKIDWLLSQFGRSRKQAQLNFRKYVLESSEEIFSWDALSGQTIMGKDDFREEIEEYARKQGVSREIPEMQRHLHRPELQEIFSGVDSKDRRKRAALIGKAYLEEGYTMQEIADHLGIHYATVSRALRKVSG